MELKAISTHRPHLLYCYNKTIGHDFFCYANKNTDRTNTALDNASYTILKNTGHVFLTCTN